MVKHCQRCDTEMPDYETHDICEACDHELYDGQTANIESEIARDTAEAYEKWCYEKNLECEHE